MYHLNRYRTSRSLIASALLIACAGAFAQDNTVRTGTVSESQCDVVAQSGSIAGESIGSVGGALLGGFIGSELGGRSGGGIGALLGGLAGSVAGEQVAATRTYKCLVKVSYPGGTPVYVELLRNKPANVGQVVVLTKDVNGNWVGR